LREVGMTVTLFDPRTGKPVTITVPDRPLLSVPFWFPSWIVCLYQLAV
jgi:hypothetical protein